MFNIQYLLSLIFQIFESKVCNLDTLRRRLCKIRASDWGVEIKITKKHNIFKRV